MHKVIETHFGIEVSRWSLMLENKIPNVQETCGGGLPEEWACPTQNPEELGFSVLKQRQPEGKRKWGFSAAF